MKKNTIYLKMEQKQNIKCNGINEERRLRVFDFDNYENNHFLAVRELYIQGRLYRRRADIIGFVNGIPLLFIELKNIHKDIKNAYEDNLKDYKDTIPYLFNYNALVILSNGLEGKVGAVTSKYEYFHDWKRIEEEDEGKVNFELCLMVYAQKKALWIYLKTLYYLMIAEIKRLR